LVAEGEEDVVVVTVTALVPRGETTLATRLPSGLQWAEKREKPPPSPTQTGGILWGLSSVPFISLSFGEGVGEVEDREFGQMRGRGGEEI
jgi:hypothetical protein